MGPGDTVFIYDHSSDLFIKAAEVIEVKGKKALVMIETFCGCIVETFDTDKLYVHRKARR